MPPKKKNAPPDDEAIAFKILNVLAAGALPALDISKAVFGKDATTKMINRRLYKLKEEGLIKRVDTGSPAVWKLCGGGDDDDDE